MTLDAILIQLRQRGLKAIQTGTPNEISLCCPFCVRRGQTSDTRFRLSVNTHKNAAYCFNCHWSSRHALQALKIAGAEGILEEEVIIPPTIQLPDDFEPLEASTDDWIEQGYEYVKKRGMTDKQIARYHVGLSMTGRAAGRVVFPIFHDRKLVGWSGRSLIKREPKWLHSKGLVYGYPVVDSLHRDWLVVVEGIFDALAVGRQYRAYGLLGTHLTDTRLRPLKFYGKILLWLDPDRAGIAATIAIAERLTQEQKELHVVMPKVWKVDPSDLTDDQIQFHIHTARKWTKDIGLELSMEVGNDG